MRVSWLPVMPWWLRPWHTAKQCRESIREQHRMITNQARVIGDVKAENRQLRADLKRLQSPPPVAAGSALERPGSITPEFVMAGFRRSSAGVRLIASRNLDGTDLGMTDMSDPPSRWKLTAKLGQALFIDRADYGEAIAEMARIWRNWEAEARAKAVEGRKAIESG